MVKEFQIGGEKVLFKASAALPILYRNLTGRNFFADVSDNERSLEVAWCMYRQANPDVQTDLEAWLDRFSFSELYSALGDILSMLTESMKSTSSAKKKNVK